MFFLLLFVVPYPCFLSYIMVMNPSKNDSWSLLHWPNCLRRYAAFHQGAQSGWQSISKVYFVVFANLKAQKVGPISKENVKEHPASLRVATIIYISMRCIHVSMDASIHVCMCIYLSINLCMSTFSVLFLFVIYFYYLLSICYLFLSIINAKYALHTAYSFTHPCDWCSLPGGLPGSDDHVEMMRSPDHPELWVNT